MPQGGITIPFLSGPNNELCGSLRLPGFQPQQTLSQTSRQLQLRGSPHQFETAWNNGPVFENARSFATVSSMQSAAPVPGGSHAWLKPNRMHAAGRWHISLAYFQGNPTEL